ncbi:hypothetical protein [Streptomyces bluensis]|uniref:hypothetical protein n=1 Tax=Streptomyces bluensis TaxID=33897 RepID=UPI00368A786E
MSRPLVEPLSRGRRARPSPLSGDHGSLGSRPFGRAGDLLARQGAQPVHGRLP